MKFSIGIPTISGRDKYLGFALQSCIAQSHGDFEIVVSDNSPGDARRVVEGFNDRRIRYVKPANYLPMPAHWDFMVSHFTGDVAVVIGDDDALMPESLARAAHLLATYGEYPVCHALAQYGWPDLPDEVSRDKLWFIHAPGGGARLTDSADFLRDLCSAKVRYSSGPAIYHSFVPRPILQQLTMAGTLFHRPAPDVYAAVTVAAHTRHLIRTGEVLTISGVSARSNGVAVRDGGAEGARFMKEAQLPQYIPRYASATVQLLTLDAILEACERYALPGLREQINYEEHFCAAANECLDMPNRSRALHQLLLVMREAYEGGCLGYLLRNRGAKLIEKVGNRFVRTVAGASREPAGPVPEARLAVPEGLSDVHAASLHLHRLLNPD